MKRILLLTGLALVALPLATAAARYSLDGAHTQVRFAVKHLMISNVQGTFSGFNGEVSYDPAAPDKSRISGTVQVATIDTGVGKRDAHLRSADFFDAAKFPAMAFVSREMKRSAPGNYTVLGDLTILGVTKPVAFTLEGLDQAITDPWGNIRRGASLTGTIDRRDFGMTWNKALEAGGVLVGHEVKITVEMELTQDK